jgi:hypothetical protein
MSVLMPAVRPSEAENFTLVMAMGRPIEVLFSTKESVSKRRPY